MMQRALKTVLCAVMMTMMSLATRTGDNTWSVTYLGTNTEGTMATGTSVELNKPTDISPARGFFRVRGLVWEDSRAAEVIVAAV